MAPRVNKTTGAGIIVGVLGHRIADIAFDASGKLWGWSECDATCTQRDDLASGQPGSDSHYAGALLSSFLEGRGITCDAPNGYTATGEKVGIQGSGHPGPYAYFKKN